MKWIIYIFLLLPAIASAQLTPVSPTNSDTTYFPILLGGYEKYVTLGDLTAQLSGGGGNAQTFSINNSNGTATLSNGGGTIKLGKWQPSSSTVATIDLNTVANTFGMYDQPVSLASPNGISDFSGNNALIETSGFPTNTYQRAMILNSFSGYPVELVRGEVFSNHSRWLETTNRWGLANGTFNPSISLNDTELRDGIFVSAVGTNATGFPAGATGQYFLEVIRDIQSSRANDVQFLHPHNAPRSNWYRRSKQTGTWGDWAFDWGSDNHGAGSGLDADLLDGRQGDYYAPVGVALTTDDDNDNATYIDVPASDSTLAVGKWRLTFNPFYNSGSADDIVFEVDFATSDGTGYWYVANEAANATSLIASEITIQTNGNVQASTLCGVFEITTAQVVKLRYRKSAVASGFQTDLLEETSFRWEKLD